MSISPLKRWSAIALLVFTLTLACGLCLIALTPKVYVATAQIQVRARGPVDPVGLTNAPPPPLEELRFPPECEIIQSQALLQPIIDDLELDKKWAKRFPVADPLAHLRSHLELDMYPGNVIRISFFSDVPIEAAEISNAIADRYKTMRDVEEDQSNTRGEDVLLSQIADQEKVVAEKRDAVERVKEKLTDDGAPTERITVDLDKREADLLRAKEDYDARRVLWKRLAPLSDREFLDTLHSLGGQHSTIEAGSNLTTQAAGLRRDMQIDCDMAKSRVELLQSQVKTLKEIEDENPQLKPMRDARSKLEQAKALLDALDVRIRQVSPDIPLPESPVRILSRAEPPSHPIQPHIPLDLFGSAFAGLLLGITVASFVELLLWLRR